MKPSSYFECDLPRRSDIPKVGSAVDAVDMDDNSQSVVSDFRSTPVTVNETGRPKHRPPPPPEVMQVRFILEPKGDVVLCDLDGSHNFDH